MLARLWISLAVALFCILGPGSSALAGGCPSPQVTCGSRCLNFEGDVFSCSECIDLSTDDRNCGACGVVCERWEVCAQGRCQLSCPPAQLVCGDRCSTPTSDPMNCGACGNECALDEYCSVGECKPITASTNGCPSGQKTCGGQCRDVSVDWAHCGSCGNACSAGQICSQGQCRSNCVTLEEPTVPTLQKPPTQPIYRR